MIQVNLLPDIKLQYLKAQHNKRLIISTSLLVILTAVGIAVLMALYVYLNQPAHTNRLQADIDQGIAELEAIENLGTILTVNQQLIALPDLHQQKPLFSRLPELLVRIVPQEIRLSQVEISLIDGLGTIRLTGSGDTTKRINQFADILKNAQYAVDGSEDKVAVFSGVEFSISIPEGDEIGFQAEMDLDATIFGATNTEVEFSVPSIVSTQSNIRTENSELFDSTTEEQ